MNHLRVDGIGRNWDCLTRKAWNGVKYNAPRKAKRGFSCWRREQQLGTTAEEMMGDVNLEDHTPPPSQQKRIAVRRAALYPWRS
jgi:hypothetical protein